MHKIPAWHTPPVHLQSPVSSQLHLWLIDIGLGGDSDIEHLSQDELDRAKRLIDPIAKRHFIASRGSLRRILAGYLGIAAEKLVFSYGAHGKPGLHSPGRELSFNLTHSGNFALLAVTENNALGIDLELASPRKNSRAIAKKVFTEETYVKMSGLDDDEFNSLFVQHWTAFEARAKCSGGGIFRPAHENLESLNFVPLPGWMAAVAGSRLPGPQSWHSFRL